jgi:acyl-CoA thioesterase I
MCQRNPVSLNAFCRNAGRRMLVRSIATLALALMSTLALAIEPTATPSSNPTPIEGKLLVFGDSLSAGYGLKSGEEWPALLQQRLAAQGSSITVVNASISGETTTGGLARLPSALASAKPRWVILELGANDGLRGYPLKTMHDNLVAMIEKATHAGAKVMLVGMYAPPNYGKPYTEGFARQFSNIAADQKLVFVPFLLEPVVLQDDLMQQDGLHPVAAGQPLLLDWLWPKIETLLKQ